nr:hypothetical protein BaRGS_005086 [Batillaria attramentaria]
MHERESEHPEERTKTQLQSQTAEHLSVPTTLSGSPELLTVKTGLESELMVLLTLPTAGSNKLLVDGINGDVDKAKRELQEHVKNNKLGRKTFKVTGAMADRAVKQWYSKQLEEAKALILSDEFRQYTATIGNTIVTIKSGDISRENVQVLVSIVGEDLNLKGTAVGGAILKRFPHGRPQASVNSNKYVKVTACGQKADVGQVVSLIKDKILKYMSQEKRESLHAGASKHGHRVTGLPANTNQVPGYWKICQKGLFRTIEEAIRSVRKHGALHAVDNEEEKAVEQLIRDTWMQRYIGAGKDGIGLTHKNIKVVKIERLENPKLWAKYSLSREECIHELRSSKKGGFTPVEKLRGSSGPVKTTTSLRKGNPLRREIYPQQLNEHYLFHGTKKDYIDDIVKDGLDSRISSDKAMLGRGIYASESATKADQYTGSMSYLRLVTRYTRLVIRCTQLVIRDTRLVMRDRTYPPLVMRYPRLVIGCTRLVIRNMRLVMGCRDNPRLVMSGAACRA